MEEKEGYVALIRPNGIEERLKAIEQKIADMLTEIRGISVKQEEENFMSRKQVAELFGVSEVTVNSWRREGIIVAHEIKNTVRYMKHEVLKAPIPKAIKK